jgi:hypothetical protein
LQLTEVTNKKTVKEFLNVPRIIYKNDPFWVCPLDKEIIEIFDTPKNPFFQHGEAIRWILKDDHGKLTGRVSAFINKRKAYSYKQPTGGIGFFECINDKTSAFMLFDMCRNWLAARGMEAMDGPVNFGENDVNWGLLVEGFTAPGVGMNYHLPYYRDLFESYGFRSYFEQITNNLDLAKPFPERFWKIADWVLKKPDHSFRHFNYSETDKFIHEMKNIYDKAWAFHESFTPLDESLIRETLKKSTSFIDPEMIWFAYIKDDPAAFLVMFPDVNQVLKHLNGKMHLWNKIKFISLIRRKTITRTRIIIMGVKPEYQRHGMESGIFWHLEKVMKHKPQYKEIELSWVGDYNPKMRALHEAVGGTFSKRHITYRKIFSDQVDFQRSVVIPVDTKEKFLKENK